MNMQSQQASPPESDDVFDMERLSHNEPEQPTPAAEIPTPSRNLRPVHFAAASAAIAAIWIFWPASAPPPTAEQQNARLFNPAADVAEHEPRGSYLAAVAAAIPQQPPMASEDPQIPAHILDQQAQQATAIISAVDSLNARTSVLEARLQALGPTGATRPARPQKNTTSERQRKSPTKILDSFALNTIFDGQAWIAHDEKVLIVREGDMIEGAKVIKIDARDHRVLTSRGVIR